MFLERMKERMNKMSIRNHCQNRPTGQVSRDRDLSNEYAGVREGLDDVHGTAFS
jgi:hypothetical protein